MSATARPAFLLIGGHADIVVDSSAEGDRLPRPYRTSQREEELLNFAGESMRGRIANRILDDILLDNADWLPQGVSLKLGELQDGLRSLDGLLAAPTAEERGFFYLAEEEHELWDRSMGEWYGKRWRDVPFILGEIYLYRRVLSLIASSMQLPIAQLPDIFRVQKDKSIRLALPLMIKLLTELSGCSAASAPCSRELFQQHLLASLWANQMDLALYNVAESLTPKHRSLLDDQSDRLYKYLTGMRSAHSDSEQLRLDIVLDNNGMELFCDLVFAVYLLRNKFVDRVVLHAKNSPFFVSDTTVADLPLFFDLLGQAQEPSLSTFVAQARACLASEQLQLTTHSFWTVAAEFHLMPDDLRSTLSKSHLVICKGDLNYRRLLGDRLWHPLTPFEHIVGYFPSPAVAALRTNKSEVIANLKIEILDDVPSDWLVSGRCAVIHFHHSAPE